MTGPFPLTAEQEAELLAQSADILEDFSAAPDDGAVVVSEDVADAVETPDEATLAAQRALLATLYGPDFPLAQAGDPDDAAWVAWAQGTWEALAPTVERHLWMVERNRLMRDGQQWIASAGPGKAWTEPPRPANTSRPVHNLITPALNFRLQVLADQRPGWRVQPASGDQDDRRQAQARQQALEYAWHAQQMAKRTKEAGYWNQTDGVSFFHVRWDADAGPLGPDGLPMGDLVTDVLRCDEVRVAPNATIAHPPTYVIVRDVIPSHVAAQTYGAAGADAVGGAPMAAVRSDRTGMARWTPAADALGQLHDRLRQQETVERFVCYVAPHPEVLPQGAFFVVVGQMLVVTAQPLPYGCVPVVPVRDGSPDPSFYPRPEVELAIDHQLRINALLQRWYDHVRLHAGGRFVGRAGAVVKETLVGGMTSIIEVNAAEPSTALIPMQGMSIGNDAKELVQFEIRALEMIMGYTDAARGSFGGDQSGRSILAQREQLERVFAPAVHAMATAFTEWAKVCLRAMRAMYDEARLGQVVGAARPDLAEALADANQDGAWDVFVEPESLMPMPRALRLWLLDDLLAKGVLSPQEYRKRHPIANTRGLESPDEDQEARASRVALAIRTGQPAPEQRWTDDEAIHQDVLQRDILTQDDLPPEVVAQAMARWTQLAQQAAMKQGGMAPPMGAGPTAPGSGPSQGAPMDPATQPVAGMMPSVAAAPVMQDAVQSDPALAAAQADALAGQ